MTFSSYTNAIIMDFLLQTVMLLWLLALHARGLCFQLGAALLQQVTTFCNSYNQRRVESGCSKMLRDRSARRQKLTLLSSPQMLTFLLITYITAMILAHLNYDFGHSSTYLTYCGMVELGRYLFYFSGGKQAGLEWLQEVYRANLHIQEVQSLHIGMIMNNCSFKGTVYIWGGWFVNDYPALQKQVVIVCLFYNLYECYDLVWKCIRPSSTVTKHEFLCFTSFFNFSMLAAGAWWMFAY